VEAKPEAAAVKDGEAVERSLDDILKGRNAVMFCNDQSKVVSNTKHEVRVARQR
jgi:hypothetical protein